MPEEILNNGLLPVLPFTEEYIPPPLRKWIMNTSENMQAPPEFCAASAIVAIGSIIGSRIFIKPKANDMSWFEAANLWGMLVAEPGMMKTPVLNEFMLPLHRMESEASKNFVEQMIMWEAKAWTSAKDKEEAKPRSVRHVVNDVTIEKLGELMADNPHGILLHRDELPSWLNKMNADNKGDRGFFLQTWTGRGAYSFDRIIRGKTRIENLCLSVIGTIQPGPLAAMIKSAKKKTTAADGFIQRFQMSIYPDPRPYKWVDELHDSVAAERAYNIFQRIPTFNFFGNEPVQEYEGMKYLKYDHNAQELFKNWLIAHQNRLGSATMASIMSVHLEKYRKLVPSLSLIFHIIDMVDGRVAPGSPISAISTSRALAWVKYLEKHAMRIYGCENTNETLILLLNRVQQGLYGPSFTIQDILKSKTLGLQDKEEVMKALGEMTELGYVTEELNVNVGNGRPFTKYTIVN